VQELGPAKPAPSLEQLIQLCGKEIANVMRQELSDEADPDRIYILRQIHQNYLYYRDLQQYAPSFYQGIVDVTGVAGPALPDDAGSGIYDYTQNIFRGFCRKLEAVLGNRMPNATAVPDNSDDEDSIRATRSANAAALYLREHCDLQQQSLYLVFSLFNFGTSFWHLDWLIDGEKNGYKTVTTPTTEPATLGNAAFNCPGCAASHPADPQNPQPPTNCPDCGSQLGPENFQPPTPVDVPGQNVQQVEKGALSIALHNGSEISVPLDATCIDDCDWLRWDREKHKAKLLKKWGDQIRQSASDNTHSAEDTVSQQYGESVRSAMASPIGLIRSKRVNYWTESDTWWTTAMYELVDDKAVRQMLYDNFPKGLRITSVRGKIVNLQEEKLQDHWQECKPEPAMRIMADPLGNDWIQPQDIVNNTLNQCSEIIERSNEPGFGDPTRIDFDAWQSRRESPGELFPALRPAGGSLSDIIYRPPPLEFSEQIGPFRQGVEETAKGISGLLDPIWGGGDAEEPTARQAELKKNAALMQLGVPWAMMGRSLEKLYEKACKLLAENEDGVLAFSQKNQFGRYSTISVIVDDLRNGKYHFEADEAIPMTWGQQRDLLMWMLDKPTPLLDLWGLSDPQSVPEFKRLMGMPGIRTPYEDDREKGMDVIGQLLDAAPLPGQPGPPDPMTGQPSQPGPPQPSIAPDWEDDHAFMAKLVRAYLTVNTSLKTEKPDGYQNVVLYGQAQEKMANEPPPPEPPKTSVSLSLKGADLGDAAVQDAAQKAGVLDPGVQVEAVIPPPKGIMPPPGANGAPPKTPIQ
jgi:hypothetical protein